MARWPIAALLSSAALIARRRRDVTAPATPGQGGLTRVRRDGLSAMRAELLPGRL